MSTTPGWWLVLFLSSPNPPLAGIEAFGYVTQLACSDALEVVEEVTRTREMEGVEVKGMLPLRLLTAALTRREAEVAACVDNGTFMKLREGKSVGALMSWPDPEKAPYDVPYVGITPKHTDADTMIGGVPRGDINDRR